MQAVQERQRCDWQLLMITVLLLILGTAVVLSSSWVLGTESFGNDGFYFFKRQVQWAGLALVALTLTLRFPYWHFRDWKLWGVGLAAAFALLVAVLVIGKEVNGSKRWISVGPIGFQPSEFAKVMMVVFLARYSELWRGRIQHLTKGFLPPVITVLGLGALVAKEDLGTAIVLIGTGLLMIVMMGARKRHVAGLIAFAVLAGCVLIAVEPYRQERISAWIKVVSNPVAAYQDAAYQPSQGLIALGSGGLKGNGVMLGTAKHLYLPEAHTDYILSTVGEETGFLGCVALLLLFAWLLIRGLTIAHRTRDWFGSLIAAGMTSMIALQAMLNVAVVTSIFPCTGVPLPFISYGGTSLLFTAVAIGMVLNVSQYPGGPPAMAREKRRRESRADGWRNRRAHLSRS
ncbi:MAG: putative lipid II flippase FtsW [Armatimonadota bacterium]